MQDGAIIESDKKEIFKNLLSGIYSWIKYLYPGKICQSESMFVVINIDTYS